MLWGAPVWIGFAILVSLALPGATDTARAGEDTPESANAAQWICVRTIPPGASVRASGGDGCAATPCMVRGGRRDVLVMRKDGYVVARVATTPETNGVYARLKKRPGMMPHDETPPPTPEPVNENTPDGTIRAHIRDADARPPGCVPPRTAP